MDGATLDISVQGAGQWQPPRKEFVRATGQVSCAEPLPDPNGYPGALPHMRHAGPPMFTPSDHPVDLKNDPRVTSASAASCAATTDHEESSD